MQRLHTVPLTLYFLGLFYSISLKILLLTMMTNQSSSSESSVGPFEDLRTKVPPTILIDRRALLEAALCKLNQKIHAEDIDHLDPNFYICTLTIGYPQHHFSSHATTKTFHGVSAASGESAAIEAYDDAVADLEDNRLITIDDIRPKKKTRLLADASWANLFEDKVVALKWCS